MGTLMIVLPAQARNISSDENRRAEIWLAAALEEARIDVLAGNR
jgi:hypothetical protein